METTQYEHTIICLHFFDEIVEKLNEMSETGWELVAVVEERHYFKRPKQKVL